MFAAMAGIAIASVAVTAISLYIVSGEGMRRNVSQRNLQIARRAAEEINLYLEDSFHFLESLSEMLMPVQDPWVADLILENAAVTYDKYRDIHLVEADMTVSASSKLDNDLAAFDEKFIKESAASNELSFSEVELSSEGLPFLKVVVPTGSRSFPRLCAALSLREIWNLVDDISFGETGKALLISGNGVLIAHPDKSKVLSMEDAGLRQYRPTDKSSGELLISRDENGIRHLTAMDDIPVTQWRVIITQHLAEAYVPFRTILIGSSIVAALSAFAAVVVSFLLVRRYSYPLNRLIAGTELIRAGKLDHRIAVDADDEFGRLSQYFNSMVSDLEERSRELAISERKYRLVTESVNDIIFMLDGHARVLYCNNQIEPVTGYSPQMLYGKNIEEFLDQESREFVSNYKPGRDSDSVIELHIFTRSGEKTTLEVRLVRVVDPEEETFYYGVARNISERKKAEARLEAYQQELRSLASQLILTEARERKKIATLIHDRIGQSLSLSRIKLGILSTQPLSVEEEKTVGEIKSLIDQIIKDTRSLIFTISSPLLYDLGLDAALERLVEQFDSENDIQFAYEGPGEKLDIETDISLLLFDAVKELLVNAVKHSGAGLVRVSMKGYGDRVMLSVKDDGKGFTLQLSGNGNRKAGGYGLFSIRERLDTIGGSFVVNSSTEGSEIVLNSPFEGKEEIEHTYSHS
jgi:PAS domain S-box-containing protein